MNLVPEKPIAEKTEQLIKMSAESPVVPLDACYFYKYVQNPKKEYSFLVLITPSIKKDGTIRQIYDQYVKCVQVLSNSYLKSHLFFGVIDLEKEPAFFQCYLRDTGMLNSRKPPMIMLYPSSKRLSNYDYIDLEGVEIEDIGDKILTLIETRVLIPPRRVDETIKYIWQKYLWFLHDKVFWAYAIIAFCIVNVSGHTWNDLKDAGLFYTTDGETYSVVAKGMKQQTVTECYFVMLLLIAFVTGMLLVIQSLDCMSENKVKCKILRIALIILGVCLVYGSYSVLHCTFHIKLNS